MSCLEISNACVRRGDRHILQNATLQVESGDVVAIVGPNGSGKSTLLRTLAGLWAPSNPEAAALLDGRPLHVYRRRELAQRISFVPQDTALDFAFTVAEIVAMGRFPYRGRLSRETQADRQAIQSAMHHCDIAHLTGRFVNTLSGGERQRVLLARSLALQPQFILLDEPTASLDIEHALGILELCVQLSSAGRAIVVATHDLNAIARYARRMVLVDKGAIVATGSRDEVLSEHSLHTVFGVAADIAYTAAGEAAYIFRRSSI